MNRRMPTKEDRRAAGRAMAQNCPIFTLSRWPGRRGGNVAARGARAAARVPIIGLLSGTDREASRLDAIWRGLNEAGYVEGRNVAIEYRWAEGRLDRLRASS